VSRPIGLVLSNVFNARGGIPRFNQMLCLALDELCPVLDLDACVVSLHDTERDWGAAGRPWKHVEFRAGGGMRRIFPHVLALAARRRFELLIIGLLGMAPLGLVCRPLVGRAGYGFIAHGIEAWVEPRFTRRFAARRASFAFAVSHDTARQLVRATGIDRERVRYLPNTLDPAFSTMPDQSVVVERPELLTVSRLDATEDRKGIDHAIRAFARVAARRPELRYRIIGRGSDRERLIALARELGVGGRVQFEQDVPDEALADAYRGCLAFVLPSGQEGFGIVFLEAMRFGKPCIGGAIGGTPEVIAAEETGLLVPYGDVDALVAAIDRLAGDPELGRRMGHAGRRRLVEHFLFDRYRERLADHLRELLQS
jgi:glycosyltransferase involved in cell wall biosynthesis